mgnify:CR=1 FL=1
MAATTIAAAGGGATGLVVRAPLEPEAVARVAAAIPPESPLVILGSGAAARQSALEIAEAAGAAHTITVDLPAIPALGSRRDLLLDVLLLKNHGARRVVLPDPPVHAR